MSTVPHLLIVAPNWLGDAVMALPAIADVVRSKTADRITIAARPAIAPLFTMVSGVHDVLTIRKGGDDALRRGRFDAALLLPNSFQSAFAVWQAGVAERWGYRTDWRRPLLTRAVAPSVDSLHQAARYQELTRALGYPSGPLECRLDPSGETQAAGRSVLAAAGWNGSDVLVALAPGAAYGGAKRWPAEAFAELAGSLAQDGIQSVLVGGTGDAAAGEELKNASQRTFREPAGKNLPAPISLIGQTDLPALAGVVRQCGALVSNDSGAMHFGAALGIPVIALFGPTDERVTRPLGRSGIRQPVLLVHDVWCRPCLLRECPLTHRCMRGIGVRTVADAVRHSTSNV
jgi:heptosyltransferase-2